MFWMLLIDEHDSGLGLNKKVDWGACGDFVKIAYLIAVPSGAIDDMDHSETFLQSVAEARNNWYQLQPPGTIPIQVPDLLSTKLYELQHRHPLPSLRNISCNRSANPASFLGHTSHPSLEVTSCQSQSFEPEPSSPPVKVANYANIWVIVWLAATDSDPAL